MAEFDDRDIEIQNETDSDPEQIEDTVGTGGTTYTPASTRKIQLAYISVPSRRDPFTSNGINDAIRFSTDGGTNWTSLLSGESIYVPGIYDNIEIESSSGTVDIQLILWS